MHKRTSELQTTRGILHHAKTTRTLVHKRLQTGGEFLPTLRKFCIPLYWQASQTNQQMELNQTLPNGGR